MEILDLSVIELAEKIKAKELTSEEVVKVYLKQIEDKKKLNAVIEAFDDAIEIARSVDERIAKGEKLGRLAGVPIIIKDNILYEGKIASCASRFLKDYKAQYSSTVVKKLLKEDAIIIGRANMDEFAMGSSTEKSYYGPTLNALDETRVPGGSSGGSASAVAGKLAPCSLGTDTGGSVRQPSSYNGVVGIKPTYGKVSRFGVIAFASSLDQVGPITHNVKDNALLLEILAGNDENDETTLNVEVPNYLSMITGDIKGARIGVCNQVVSLMKDKEHFNSLVEWFKSQGAVIEYVDIPDIELCLPVYYILAPAEATSNLGRFDGVKYSTRAESAENVNEIYRKSRSEGFGEEVKRRIMLGNFVLSSGYFDAYYNKAKKLQQKIKKQFAEAFKKCDVIITPTTFGEAFKLGEITDPVQMYMEDIFTISANIASIPAISIPCGKGKNNMPLGLQILANENEEGKIYNVADYFENNYKESN
ncbi:MAG: Asp-tRNA(Asn)/Glu-tRNA(Gln) amidotransferase subunit GatA [Clostridia bacterium]|nr:Asp-tRNA(Asn)/Glu-tRNA(Gln) amidotransferase subunit GatA [Clostridia bacterium]